MEGGEEETDFSVNRDCARECSPDCIVIGDRTKVGGKSDTNAYLFLNGVKELKMDS